MRRSSRGWPGPEVRPDQRSDDCGDRARSRRTSSPRRRVASSTAYEIRKWRVAAAEDVAGDDQQVAADRLGDELGRGAPGGPGEGVEGAFGRGELEVVGQGLDDHVALAAVGVDLGREVLVERDDPGVLDDARGADEAELLELGHLLDQPARAVGEAEPPAGHAVGLAEAVDDQHLVVPGGGGGERVVVAEGAIDLVADQQDAPLAAELGQAPASRRPRRRRRSGWPAS